MIEKFDDRIPIKSMIDISTVHPEAQFIEVINITPVFIGYHKRIGRISRISRIFFNCGSEVLAYEYNIILKTTINPTPIVYTKSINRAKLIENAALNLTIVRRPINKTFVYPSIKQCAIPAALFSFKLTAQEVLDQYKFEEKIK